MITHIKNCLIEKQCVCIPMWGKLSIQYKEADIHPILHTFTPPGHYVQFAANGQESDLQFVQ